MSFAIPLILFLIPLAFSPGPGNLFFAALAARFGAKATLPALFGYHVATIIVTFVVGLGFEIGTGSNMALTRALAAIGSIYVLYLAWKLVTSKVDVNASVDRAASFMDGFFLLVFNPKAYVIIALLFTQFPPTQHMASNPLLGNVIISAAFTLHNLFAFVVWILASDKVGSGFRTPDNFKRMNIIFGGLLAAVAIWLFVSNLT